MRSFAKRLLPVAVCAWAAGALGAEDAPASAADAVRVARAEYELRRAAAHARLEAQEAVAPSAAHPAVHAAKQKRASTKSTAATPAANGKSHLVPFLPRARTSGREGVVRIVHLGEQSGEVSIEATDDGGRGYGPLTLAIGAGRTTALSAEDLQQGNSAKGLAGRLGPPHEGDWRLAITSTLELRVQAHVRVAGGVFAALHERLRKASGERRVALFNPADSPHPSGLRLINPGDEPATVTVRGVDDAGASPGEQVQVRLLPGTARTITASALENGEGVSGALGDGTGRWRLVLRSDKPIHAAHLLANEDGRLANLSVPATPPTRDGDLAVHRVPVFPTATAQAQGLLRVINASDTAGEVAVQAVDDAGRQAGPVTFTMAARESKHFTAHDLEQGNDAKGVSGALGAGEGAWRLRLRTVLEVRVLAYHRAADGFLTDLNATAPAADGIHEVAVLEGGQLRLVNWGAAAAEATISGVDDNGDPAADEVRVTVPADAVLTLTAAELEAGAAHFTGALGAGDGAWRLSVRSEAPLQVLSLLPGADGRLANLSTFAVPEDATAAGIFAEHVAPIVQTKCVTCHVAGGVAAGARLIFQAGDDAETRARNLRAFADFLAQVADGADVILHRVQGVGHGGGIQVAGDTEDHAHLARFLARLGEDSAPAAPSPATLFDGVVMESPSATLRRAALVFAGRVPTPAEYAAVANGDAAALRQTLRGLMTGAAFHEFLLRAGNDRLLTDRELARFSVIGNDGYFVDYDNEYIRLRRAGGRAVWEWHHAVQYGAGRAPLELIAHVVENELPYTEVLTANYIMANPAAAGIYGAATVFGDLADVHEFKPATITRYHHHGPGYEAHFDPGVGLRVLSPGPLAPHHPLVGVLNTKAFLQRYPTTATNRNRARSRWAYYHFLGVDVERSAPRTTDPVALADRDNPTLRNAACTVCHGALDPLAGAFQNYGDSGYFRDQWGGLDALDYFYKNGADSAEAVRGQSSADRALASWTLTLPAGDNTLGVTYTNDYYDEETGEDGILFLDRLRVVDDADREVAHYEFEAATPVAPWGPCGEPRRSGHLMLWNGGFECAIHIPLTVYTAGEHRVEILAWARRHANYGDDGYAKISVVANPYRKGDTWYRDMRVPGFNGAAVPDADHSLAAVARQITKDERFAPATVRFWWPALMGSEVADLPREDDPDFHGRLLGATAQQAEVARLAAGFRHGFRGGPPYNLKDLLVELALSPWFRASAAGELDAVHQVALRHAGAKRLLTPEELTRKTAALTGFEWGRWHHPARKPHRQRSAWLTDEEGYRLLYGGIDSDGVTSRGREMTSVMAGVAKSHAAHVSCPVVLRELYLLPDAERRLFAGINASVSPHFELAGDFALATARKTYTVRGTLAAGDKTAFLKFPNDYADPHGDRNVRLDRLTLRHGDGRVAQTIELETLPAQNDCNLPVDDHYALHCRGWLEVPFTVDAPGQYAVDVHAWADAYGDEAAQLQVVVDAHRATTPGERAIKRKIAQLHQRLLGISPEAAAAEAETAYDLFVEIWQRKRATGETLFWDAACHWDSDIHFLDRLLPDAVGEREADYGPYRHWRWNRVNAFWEQRDTADPHYAARAWVAVLAHLLTDYRYLHL